MLETDIENKLNSTEMRVTAHPLCYLCGSAGSLRYENLTDRLHDVAGNWAIRKCENTECGLVWLDPMPIEADIGKAYAQYFTHAGDFNSFGYRLRQRIKRGYVGLKYNYARQTSLWDRLLALPLLFTSSYSEQVICTVCEMLQAPSTGKLLEIGCGSGTLLNTLAELGWDVEGIDFDPQAVENARRSFQLNVKAGTLHAQNYPANQFDAIVMSHVIEHLHDPQKLLLECHRILKPGGKLLLLTPNIESGEAQKFGANWLHLDPPRHLYLFSPQTIQTVVQRAGLQINVIKTSARDAAMSWVYSQQIAQQGKCQRDAPIDPLLSKQGKDFAVNEKKTVTVKSNLGGEIILLAVK